MPELAIWVLIIALTSPNSVIVPRSRAITVIDGFTEVSCTEAAIRAKNMLGDDTVAFCIARVGRR